MLKLCQSNIIFPSVMCPFICPSCYLLLNLWQNLTKLALWLPLMVRMCESNIIFPCPFRHAISQTTGLNLTKLATWLPFLVKVCESESVHLSIMLLATVARSVGICNGGPSTAHSSYICIYILNIRNSVDNFWILFLIFLEKQFGNSFKLSSQEIVCMKWKTLFSFKNKKNISSSDKLA